MGHLIESSRFCSRVVHATEKRPPGFNTRFISSKDFCLFGARQNAPFDIEDTRKRVEDNGEDVIDHNELIEEDA